MAGQMKTPGVYIVEKDAFPNSVVEVETAIPAFIGYTEKADSKGTDLTGKPVKIRSFAEYQQLFGGAGSPTYEIKEGAATPPPTPPAGGGGNNAEPVVDGSAAKAEVTFRGKKYELLQKTGAALLPQSIRWFFMNGGGACYIISMGALDADVTKADFLTGIETLVREPEVTLLVAPDAVRLSLAECGAVQQQMLAHCEKMANRFSILDVHNGYKGLSDPTNNVVNDWREEVKDSLKYGAAYYPWIVSSIYSQREIGFENITNPNKLNEVIIDELGLGSIPAGMDPQEKARLTAQKKVIDSIKTVKPTAPAEELARVNNTVRGLSNFYDAIMREITDHRNLMPPSGAMAGIYARVDSQRGVWKAPANVGVASAQKPHVSISDDEQADLNVDTNGKSINALRHFIGEGVMVWGARTLDGNSLDWRYINVRRTLIMLEESIKLASRAYVFEPNTANTWVTMKGMIANFLTGIWKRGGLAGATPQEAFSVHVGLGETMTAEDILEGRLLITVLVAPSRPAEFIEITFQQQLQQS